MKPLAMAGRTGDFNLREAAAWEGNTIALLVRNYRDCKF